MQTKWLKLTCLSIWSILIIGSAKATDDNGIIPSIKLSAVLNKNNQRGEIRWYTMPGKTNMLRFELQKSVDGNTFSYVTSVAGDRHNSMKQYFAEDRNLFQGDNFYRLKIIFDDGTQRYTTAIQMASAAPGVTILPTVADEKVYIWLPENTHISEASITDISGKIIFQNAVVTTGAGLANIDVKKLSPGFYNLIVRQSPTEKIHLKFSKK